MENAAGGEAGFHEGADAEETHIRQSGSKSGKLDNQAQSHQLPIQCPECSSERLWKDGLRYLNDGRVVQRWVCRNCGYRFSEPNVKVPGRVLGGPNPVDDLARGVPNLNLSYKESFDDASPLRREDYGTNCANLGQDLNTFRNPKSARRVCASEGGAKNSAAKAVALAEEKSLSEKWAAGATEKLATDIKGKIVQYMWHLKKQGYAEDVVRNRVTALERLIALGVDLNDPETVKEALARQEGWRQSYKLQMVYAYECFLKMCGLTWERPRYKQERTLPFIPTEEELNQLIAGSGKILGTFLQGLKDTGADPGELAKLKWTDVNFGARTVTITPVKGHEPRVLKVSDEFLRRVGALPRKGDYVFGAKAKSLDVMFWRAKMALARKLDNPRLKAVHLTTFRHWKGTMEYHRTRDILHVKKLLGHKNIENTMVYVNLEGTVFNDECYDFHVAVAKNAEEACELIKHGFEYVTGEYTDGGKIFRKRK